jgi:hypothetical protein
LRRAETCPNLVRQSLIWRPIVGVDRGCNLFDGSIIASTDVASDHPSHWQPPDFETQAATASRPGRFV